VLEGASGVRDEARQQHKHGGHVTAPPIRVAIWANGMSCIRLAAVRIATSPVPP
jgi:hypothetical protein